MADFRGRALVPSNENHSGVYPPADLLRDFSDAETWLPTLGVVLAYGARPVINDGLARPQCISALAGPEVQKYCALAIAAVEAGELPAEPSPLEFIKWADTVGLAFHERWFDALSLVRFNGRAMRQSERREILNAQMERELVTRWARAPSWTLDEGAALSLNMLPSIKSRPGDSKIQSAFALREFQHRLAFAGRAAARQELPSEPTPREFIYWARGIGFRFSDAWEEAVAGDRRLLEKGEATPSSPPDLSTRERDSLLKLVIGMAIGGYGFDPGAPRNQGTADIANDLDRIGVSLDRNTILKWLRAAAELLPRDGDQK